MAFYIDNIEVTAESIRNAIIYFCNKTTDERGRTIPRRPTFIPSVEKDLLYEYIILFGIRVTSCDTSLPDDIIGALRYLPNRISSGGRWEMEIANASVDPSPLYLQPPINKVNGKCPTISLKMPNGGYYSKATLPCNESIWSGVGVNPFINKCCVFFDSQARSEGGAAWIAPGQYLYYFYGNFKGEPAFAPAKPVTTYRWSPSRLGETFSANKIVKQADNSSTFIHRTWFKDKLFNDSAGCNVIPASDTLKTMEKWAKAHLTHKVYSRNFQYTLMNKEDFLSANVIPTTTKDWWKIF